MQKTEIFEILGIEPVKDEDKIKQAYMEKLSCTNPEDDPEGFKLLRQAYDEAMTYCAEEEESGAVKEWMDEVQNIYGDFEKRIDVKCWEDVFSAPVVDDMGTFNEAREAFLVYLMDHTFLPKYVFELINRVFDIENSKEELCELFPEGYIDYVMANGSDIGVEFCQTKSGDKADALFELLYEILRTNIEDSEKYESIIKRYLEIGDVFPPISAIIAVYYAKDNDKRYEPFLKAALPFAGMQNAVLRDCGLCAVLTGDRELYDKLDKYERDENSNTEKLFDTYYYALNEEYEKVRENCDFILNRVNSLQAYLLLDYANKKIMEKLENVSLDDMTQDELYELSKSYDSDESFVEKLGEVIARFDLEGEPEPKMLMEASKYYEKINDLEKALKYAKQNLDAVKNKADDEEDEEAAKEIIANAKALYCNLLLRSSVDVDEDKKKEYMYMLLDELEHIEPVDDMYTYLGLNFLKASACYRLERYDDARNLCDFILEKEPKFSPAVAVHMESSFEDGYYNDAINDFYSLRELMGDNVANMSRFYGLVANCFFAMGSYDSAVAACEDAKKRGVESDYVEFMLLASKRFIVRDNSEIQAVKSGLIELYLKDKRTDFGKFQEESLLEEIVFSCMDLEEWVNAESYAEKLLDKREDEQTYSILLNIAEKSGNEAMFDTWLGKYAQSKGKDAFYYMRKGQHFENSDVDKAIEFYKKSLKTEWGYRNVFRRIADLYRRKSYNSADPEFVKQAEDYYTLAIESQKSIDNVMERGIFYLYADMPEKAEKDFKAGLERNDEHIILNEWCGDALRSQCKFDEALKHYELAYELAKGNGNVNPGKDLAVCLMAMKRYEEAEKLLLELRDEFSDELAVYEHLVTIAERQGELKKALKYNKQYIDVLHNASGILNAYHEHILILAGLGDKKKAKEYAIKGERFDKNNPLSHRNIAVYNMLFTGNKNTVLYHLKRGLELAGDSKYYKKKLYDQYVEALCFFKCKRLLNQESNKCDIIDIYGAPDKADGGRKSSYYSLALQCFYLGKFEEFEKYYSRMKECHFCTFCTRCDCIELDILNAIKAYMDGDKVVAVQAAKRIMSNDSCFDPLTLRTLLRMMEG